MAEEKKVTKKTASTKKSTTTKKATTGVKKAATKKTTSTKKATPKTKTKTVKEEKIVKEEVKEEIPVVEAEKVEEKKEEKKTEEQKTTNNNSNKTVTSLSIEAEIILVYLITVLGFIFAFVAEKDVSDRAKFAYKQSGALFICSLVLGFFSLVPLIGMMFMLANVGIFVLSLIALIKGYQGEDFKIPLIYDLAEIIWKNK